jgi:hypothetical protein
VFWKPKITAQDKEQVLGPLREMSQAFRTMAADCPKIEVKSLSATGRWTHDEIVRQANEAVRKLVTNVH